jgi:hypothetical protein
LWEIDLGGVTLLALVCAIFHCADARPILQRIAIFPRARFAVTFAAQPSKQAL